MAWMGEKRDYIYGAEGSQPSSCRRVTFINTQQKEVRWHFALSTLNSLWDPYEIYSASWITTLHEVSLVTNSLSVSMCFNGYTYVTGFKCSESWEKHNIVYKSLHWHWQWQVILITLMIALFFSGVPVSSDGVTVSLHADPENDTAKWNPFSY